jgi:hypothetical protein
VWRIIRDALGDASPRVRAFIRWLACFWVAMLALQIWDSRNASGAPGVAELLSAALGISGVGLLGLANSLHLVMQEAAGRRASARDGPSLQRVLLALPMIGFVAGVMLGAAAVLMALRGLLGAEWPFAVVGTLLYSGMAVVAAKVVAGSTRTLFDYGAAEAQAAGELRLAAAASRLEALQARMNPHMLFNALNTVASLVRTSPAAAERVVEDLGDLLRRSLERSERPLSTVREEVEYVRAFLAVEHARWGDALAVTWQIDPLALDTVVPPFVLQPIVENALGHGLGARLDGGHVTIAIERRDAGLRLMVADDGAGFRAGWREGTGLGNLRGRLRAVYGDAASIAMEPVSPGARVIVNLPDSMGRT